MRAIKYLICLLFIPSFSHALFRPVRPYNLYLYLPLKEGAGTELRDYSVYADSASLIGAVAWVKDPGGYATQFGTKTWASTIDGTVYLPNTGGTRIEVRPNTRLSFNNEDWTILWVGSFEPPTNNAIIMYDVGGTGPGCGSRNGWGLWQRLDATAGCVLISVSNCGQANNYNPTNKASCIPDQFTHMWVVTKTGNNLAFYRDGTRTGTATMAGGFGSYTAQPLIVGDGFASIAPNELTGKFGPFAIWLGALTDDEIRWMWENYSGRE